jgi:ribosomal-protein-alanine acetyltransferase
VNIRSFVSDDLKGIYEIEHSAFDVGPYNIDEIIEMVFSKDAFTLVATDSDEYIGYVTAVPLNEYEVDIESIAVIPKYQGRHLGDSLLDSIEEIIKKKGYKKSVLEVREKNYVAINFYLKHGYVKSEFLKNYYCIPYKGSKNAFRMVKSL